MTAENDTAKKLNAYVAFITYDNPMQGQIVMTAASEEEAKDVLTAAYERVSNFNILSIHDIADIDDPMFVERLRNPAPILAN